MTAELCTKLLILEVFIISNGYSAIYTSYGSDQQFSCPLAGIEDTCIMHCDVSDNVYHFDCGNAGECYFYCSDDKCMEDGTLNARNSNNLYAFSSRDQCMTNNRIYAPNYGNAYIAINNIDQKELKRMKVYSGSNTESININCTGSGREDCREIEVYAENTTYLQITGNSGSIMQNAQIHCPQNSSYLDGIPCNIDFSKGGTIKNGDCYTLNGIPSDIMITGILSGKITVHCLFGETVNNGDSFQNEGICWNTEHPTTNPTQSPTVNPSIYPTLSPSQNPTSLPSTIPSANPTKMPSMSPTINPSIPPTINPSKSAILSPTVAPTNNPTSKPSNNPTIYPSIYPTASLSNNPTAAPTSDPTVAPSHNPTSSPSNNPTSSPSNNPTAAPTENPSIPPTEPPTNTPILKPTADPTSSSINNEHPSTNNPTLFPTDAPTDTATYNPTTSPAYNPTASPTNIPSSTSEQMISTSLQSANTDNASSSLHSLDLNKVIIILILIIIICCIALFIIIIKKTKCHNNTKKNTTHSTDRTDTNTTDTNTPSLGPPTGIGSNSIRKIKAKLDTLAKQKSFSDVLMDDDCIHYDHVSNTPNTPNIQMTTINTTDIDIVYMDDKTDDIKDTEMSSTHDGEELYENLTDNYETPQFPDHKSSNKKHKKHKTNLSVYKMEGVAIENRYSQNIKALSVKYITPNRPIAINPVLQHSNHRVAMDSIKVNTLPNLPSTPIGNDNDDNTPNGDDIALPINTNDGNTPNNGSMNDKKYRLKLINDNNQQINDKKGYLAKPNMESLKAKNNGLLLDNNYDEIVYRNSIILHKNKMPTHIGTDIDV